MVENKVNWNTVLVVLVIGVVGVLLLGNSGILTGKLLSGSYNVVANSCNADALCEATAVTSTGSVNAKEFLATGGPIRMTNPSWYIHSDGWLGTKGFLLVGSTDNTGMVAGKIRASDKIEAKEFLATNGPIIMGSSGWYIWSNGYIGADGLKGIGKAYACITSDGVITRSPTPCI
ncbi:hypothetical protein HY498_05555 [Candidatus Woesearchaeota archaeon]|nr:hypothetical protein [Candidatus Woesearchaeota archaeon]